MLLRQKVGTIFSLCNSSSTCKNRHHLTMATSLDKKWSAMIRCSSMSFTPYLPSNPHCKHSGLTGEHEQQSGNTNKGGHWRHFLNTKTEVFTETKIKGWLPYIMYWATKNMWAIYCFQTLSWSSDKKRLYLEVRKGTKRGRGFGGGRNKRLLFCTQKL